MHPLHGEILRMIEDATQGMTEEQLAYRQPEKWSSANILEHLSMTFGGTARRMQRCADANEMSSERPNIKQRAIDFIVLDVRYFPGGRKAPEQVTPEGKMGGQQAITLLRQNLAAMDKA